MKDMKCSMSKLFRSFFIFVLILIIVFPATGFAAKTKKSSSADLKSNKNVQNTDMTKKYKKQMNNILEATQLFYSVRLNYSMKSGESKKIKLTSLEKQNIAAGRQILEEISTKQYDEYIEHKGLESLSDIILVHKTYI